ncbi:hypothetical protein VH571_01590 [Frondihabitans sp. 4ASC-45]|uniref:hypothetical protein n=1 Tax=Frondihabitans sp. 4ASC-45 TaxID=3111636 RepID=UPI003C1DAA66
MTNKSWSMQSDSTVQLSDLISAWGAFDPETSLTKSIFAHDDAASPPPKVTFVVPVHNQEGRIAANLTSITSNAAESHELVVILDGCRDGSQDAVMAWVMVEASRSLLSRVTVLASQSDLFETICDSIGVAIAAGRYIVEVQADMHIEQKAFDSALVAALETVPELALVSGRGAHSFAGMAPRGAAALISFAKRVFRRGYGIIHGLQREHSVLPGEWLLSDEIGRVGNFIESPLAHRDEGVVYLHETVMRGPLAFEKSRFHDLGGLDVNSFFLGDDDHDLALRAWGVFRWRAGHLPIQFSSPLEAGSTRVVRTEEDAKRFRALSDHYGRARQSSYLEVNLSLLPRPRPRRIRLRSTSTGRSE